MPELAYVNGVFVPLGQATVSVEDRGFQFADGVYEVLIYHKEQPLMLEEHLERLQNSCSEIDLPIDVDDLGLRQVFLDGVRRTGFETTMVYCQVTRGAASRNHVYSEDATPTLVVTYKPKPVLEERVRREGIAVMTIDDFRWSMCNIKSIALLPNVLAKNRAIAAGFRDAIFIGPQGRVREATSANVFVVKDGVLCTPPQDQAILPGITRRMVLSCAADLGIEIRQEHITKSELLAADEVFISSTTIDALGVVSIDREPIADQRPGPMTKSLYQQMESTYLS